MLALRDGSHVTIDMSKSIIVRCPQRHTEVQVRVLPTTNLLDVVDIAQLQVGEGHGPIQWGLVMEGLSPRNGVSSVPTIEINPREVGDVSAISN